MIEGSLCRRRRNSLRSARSAIPQQPASVDHEWADSPTPPYEWAAAVAGIVSYHGNIDPARPFQTLALKGVLPAKQEDRLTLRENNQAAV